jgi:hypothetical protein
MGRGDRAIRRWKKDRQRKKKERDKKSGNVAPPRTKRSS